tara:strand:- start:47 stop:295 length:249 start_codon:yes stop_codon:yes gene_type:complete
MERISPSGTLQLEDNDELTLALDILDILDMDWKIWVDKRSKKIEFNVPENAKRFLQEAFDLELLGSYKVTKIISKEFQGEDK